MLLSVVLLIVVFLVSLWFTSFIAKALGAQRPGMGWVLLVFLALMVVQVVFGLTPLVQHPVIALLLLVLISSFIYSKILEMKLLNGFITMLVSSIVSGILTVAVVLIVGINLPGMQGLVMKPANIDVEVTLESAAIAAEAVCECETDKKCLRSKSDEFGQVIGLLAMNDLSASDEMTLQRYTQRGFECTLKPGPYDVAKAVIRQKARRKVKPVFEDEVLVSTEQPSAEEVIAAIRREPVKTETRDKKAETDEVIPVQPAYQTVSVKDVKKHIGQPVRLLRKSGVQLEGTIIAAKHGKLMVEQRRFGGTFSYPVKLKEIKSLEVYF